MASFLLAILMIKLNLATIWHVRYFSHRHIICNMSKYIWIVYFFMDRYYTIQSAPLINGIGIWVPDWNPCIIYPILTPHLNASGYQAKRFNMKNVYCWPSWWKLTPLCIILYISGFFFSSLAASLTKALILW